MFAIYENGVRSFSGTLERLREDRPVEAVRGVDPKPGEEEVPNGIGFGAGSGGLSADALAAYRSATNRDAREPILHAHQVMTFPVVTIDTGIGLREAWERLRRHGIRQAPVVSSRLELVGLLSEKQLLERLLVDEERIRFAPDATIDELLDTEVVTAEPVTDVRRIARVMIDRNRPAMPIVTDRGELVGIVSRGDLLRAMDGNPPLRLWT